MNAPLRPLAEGLPRRRFSVADVVRMAEVGLIGHDERLEILDGEIVPMSAKGARHEAIKVALAMFWGRARPDGFVVASETGLYLNAMTYIEPDFIVFEHSVGIADVRGPDVLLAVEVADSSLDYDLNRKPAIYASFGVRELWVIDAARRVTHVHCAPAADGYAEVRTHGAADRVTPSVAPRSFAVALDDLPSL